jgi:hypothetical protein
MPLKVTPDNQQRAASLVKTMLHAPKKISLGEPKDTMG